MTALFESLSISSAFLAILAVGFTYIVGTSLLGAIGFGDDVDADAHDGDASHDHETVSIFSPKVIAIFMVGFGGAGFIATYYGAGLVLATLSGFTSGAALGAVALFGLRLLHSQQASSEVRITDAIGQPATVTVAIPTVGHGEVGVTVKGQYLTYSASSRGVAIARNTTVRVQAAEGSNLIVG